MLPNQNIFLLSLFLQHDIQTHKQTNAQTNKQPNSKTNWTNSTNTFERETKKKRNIHVIKENKLQKDKQTMGQIKENREKKQSCEKYQYESEPKDEDRNEAKSNK